MRLDDATARAVEKPIHLLFERDDVICNEVGRSLPSSRGIQRIHLPRYTVSLEGYRGKGRKDPHSTLYQSYKD